MGLGKCGERQARPNQFIVHTRCETHNLNQFFVPIS